MEIVLGFGHECKFALGKVSKKVRNFLHFSGVGGFEKVIFHKKIKTWSEKCLKLPKYSLKVTYFFQYGGWSEIQMASRSVFWTFSMCCQNAYFCLKMIFRPCYFFVFFSILGGEWGGCVLESMENSIFFFFFF